MTHDTKGLQKKIESRDNQSDIRALEISAGLKLTHDTGEVEEIVEQFEKRMPLITSHGLLLEARLTPTSYLKMKEWLRTTLHHQLQKAREEGLRTFIEKQQLLLENNEGRDNFEFYSGYRTALLDIKHLMSKAYHSELDQDKTLNPYDVRVEPTSITSE